MYENDDDLNRWCCAQFIGTKVETLVAGLNGVEEELDTDMFIQHLLRLLVGFVYVNDPEVKTYTYLLLLLNLVQSALEVNNFFKLF